MKSKKSCTKNIIEDEEGDSFLNKKRNNANKNAKKPVKKEDFSILSVDESNSDKESKLVPLNIIKKNIDLYSLAKFINDYKKFGHIYEILKQLPDEFITNIYNIAKMCLGERGKKDKSPSPSEPQITQIIKKQPKEEKNVAKKNQSGEQPKQIKASENSESESSSDDSDEEYDESEGTSKKTYENNSNKVHLYFKFNFVKHCDIKAPAETNNIRKFLEANNLLNNFDKEVKLLHHVTWYKDCIYESKGIYKPVNADKANFSNVKFKCVIPRCKGEATYNLVKGTFVAHVEHSRNICDEKKENETINKLIDCGFFKGLSKFMGENIRKEGTGAQIFSNGLVLIDNK